MWKIDEDCGRFDKTIPAWIPKEEPWKSHWPNLATAQIDRIDVSRDMSKMLGAALLFINVPAPSKGSPGWKPLHYLQNSIGDPFEGPGIYRSLLGIRLYNCWLGGRWTLMGQEPYRDIPLERDTITCRSCSLIYNMFSDHTCCIIL